MVWPFKRKEPPVAPQEVAIVPVNSPNVRIGMWVIANGKVGIVSDYQDGNILVTHTKSDGSNVMVMSSDEVVVPDVNVYPAQQVAQAKISDIPRSRYESVEQLKTLGYGD